MSEEPGKIIWIIKELLTDGSFVFNVEVDLEKLSAISESDAYALAQKIEDAVNEHSLEKVGVMEA